MCLGAIMTSEALQSSLVKGQGSGWGQWVVATVL